MCLVTRSWANREDSAASHQVDPFQSRCADRQRLGLPPILISADAIIGISASLSAGTIPANGLRHPSETGETGWYLWGGEELSAAPDFFQPMHASHLVEDRP